MLLTNQQLIERFNARKPSTGIIFKSNIVEIRAEDGFVRMSYTVGPEFANPGGSVQGGIVTALLDDACALAVICKSGQPIFMATLELKTSFFSPAKPGLLFAEALVIKLGRTVAFVEAELTDESGKRLARMSTTTAPRLLDKPAHLIDV